MKTEKDYEELLRLFNKNKVKYCIVGAYAVGFHTVPRYTKDIDILVEPEKENAMRIIKSLKKFGFKNIGLKTEDFYSKGKIIQLGYEPVRIDILTSLKGCTFNEVWKGRVCGAYGKEKVFFIGPKELIKSKKSTKRPVDKIDIAKLKKIQNK